MQLTETLTSQGQAIMFKKIFQWFKQPEIDEDAVEQGRLKVVRSQGNFSQNFKTFMR